jgi:hypothetical protein
MAKAFGGMETAEEEDREAKAPKNDTMKKRHAKAGDLIRNGDTRMVRSLQASRKASGKR